MFRPTQPSRAARVGDLDRDAKLQHHIDDEHNVHYPVEKEEPVRPTLLKRRAGQECHLDGGDECGVGEGEGGEDVPVREPRALERVNDPILLAVVRCIGLCTIDCVLEG